MACQKLNKQYSLVLIYALAKAMGHENPREGTSELKAPFRFSYMVQI